VWAALDVEERQSVRREDPLGVRNEKYEKCSCRWYRTGFSPISRMRWELDGDDPEASEGASCRRRSRSRREPARDVGAANESACAPSATNSRAVSQPKSFVMVGTPGDRALATLSAGSTPSAGMPLH